MRYYLAVDIGASSGRHIVAWLDDGKLQTQEIYRFENAPIVKVVDGKKRLTWNVEKLFEEIVIGLQKAKEIGKIPCSVGVDTWGVDYVLLDEKDNPIGDTYCYRDVRTQETVPMVHERIAFAQLYAKTGIGFNTFNTVYQLMDEKRTGRMQQASSMLHLPDYFHFRLTGVKKQEYTMSTTTGMVNAKTHTWDRDILQTLGYKESLFGELTQPSSLVGEFTDEMASVIGYKAKVFLPATHDTASAVLAAPLSGQTPYISSGTWSLLGVEQNYAHTQDAARVAGYSNEGSVHGQFRLQMNIMGLWMIQQVRHELHDEYSFAQLADMARENPVDDCVDVNDERFLAPESMIAEIDNAVGRPLSVGQRAYVIFNSLAKYYAKALSALEEITTQRYDTLNIIGGGSKNTLLNELTAKYTGKKIVAGPTECTALGNLTSQMIGMGDIATVQESREIIQRSFDITTL